MDVRQQYSNGGHLRLALHFPGASTSCLYAPGGGFVRTDGTSASAAIIQRSAALVMGRAAVAPATSARAGPDLDGRLDRHTQN